MSKKLNRRELLKGAAAGGVGLLILRSSKSAFAYEANGKLNVAVIGCGGRGGGNLHGIGATENIVALCDVDSNAIAAGAKDFPKAKHYTDIRRLLDEMGSQIDAVAVSTPDHTHAPAAVMAVKMGKHCYCEKPLAHSVWEARVMRDTARQHKVATQMGNQGTAEPGFREAVEVVRSGAIGQVYQILVWSNRPIWPQGMPAPSGATPVPKELAWDDWLGPAAARPYSPEYLPFKWRGWVDFGTGALGDMGCHTVNMPFMSLNLRNPISVTAKAIDKTDVAYPKQSIVEWSFPQRGDLRAARMTWYDGGLKPDKSVLDGRELPGSGVLLLGEKGKLFSPDDYGSSYQLLPKEQFANFQKPPQTLPRSPGHYAEWIRACKGGEAAMSNFDYASALTETILLGNLAIVTGKPIYWDSDNMRAIGCPEADAHIHPAYRTGWSL